MTKLMLSAAFVAMTLVAPLSIAQAEDAHAVTETTVETTVVDTAESTVCTDTNDAGEEVVVECPAVDAEAASDAEASVDAEATTH